ncbi:MAG: UDP-3-O-acyl-N-acetylglucosamine deacetylase [Rhodospirillaceae bacterium]|jgi:UDP-3-O-[3-hydroxymyristoyl] N-acetylglucosamine deacetylase|nr:UDP-3-O-acyl-N-acetylglucosamine deacetylase [Rhodospirillaceae bacterium]MBT4218780.1 UDP-3-O-acyl-N-acetylglucosamine deacetylase [Rhodospirillaceae bacterium]MBT4463576.1 UDP-3-O-acyl-N-acetylglucosamine deacetylase [Rhodospirillaceae bacterium]MBT5012842.1 UDP-3-O-acyl-N-acetylglucosamine deacetylase [Rhodospirillaceae bacterium]MBT5309497.1 UDP-3-O-acyl-N-acetylglucosamine deacetylase [Rhodospirillaceae bacterium]
MIKQRTLKTSINCSGVALHSGDKVTMTLLPADAGSGITFKRTDIAGGGAEIKATWDNVVETTMCTTLGNDDGVTIATVEHLMAALAGSGVDNVIVEVNGPEVPVMDGSAAPFVFLVECAGIVEQDAPRRYIRVLKAVSVDDGDKTATLLPNEAGNGLSMDFEINFDNAAVAQQSISVGAADTTFKKELSRARTFGFLHEVEALRAAGLAKGGSLDNAVVVSGDKILNEDGLRYDDEFVRHKVLDAVGDLYLAGGGLLGHFTGVCTGHAANNTLLRTLFADDSAWCYEELSAADVADVDEVTGWRPADSIAQTA